jgi:ectoine hydroxylase-related dioxygenase (phytanoyl-CoA dioxygenase family)
MTPEEKYCFDVRGYLIVEDAIEPDYLALLNRRLDVWEDRARHDLEKRTNGERARGPAIGYFSILNEEPSMLDLVANPAILPYVDALVQSPILEQFGVNFRWMGGQSTVHGGHVPHQPINFYHVSQGRIYNNHLRVMYAMNDIGPGDGGLQIIPGSHKANFSWPGEGRLGEVRDGLRDLFVELPVKAGSAVVFTHDILHASISENDVVRRVLHLAYNFCGITRWWFAEKTDYDHLFDQAAEGSWLKYLLRAPAYTDTIPKPELPQ